MFYMVEAECIERNVGYMVKKYPVVAASKNEAIDQIKDYPEVRRMGANSNIFAHVIFEDEYIDLIEGADNFVFTYYDEWSDAA